MNKNLFWKFSFVGLLIVMCILSVYPPGKKLKLGIDLAGGTSLLYRIDTTDLNDWEKREIAQTMIRILQQRIDPGNKRNLVWRPNGNDCIEIQMPLAEQATIDLRKAYQTKCDAVENQNLNMRLVRQALVKPAGMSQADYQDKRQREFDKLAGGSEGNSRLELLKKLGEAQDALTEGKARREAALEAEKKLSDKLDEAKINLAGVDALYQQWNQLDDPNRTIQTDRLTKGDDNNKTLVLEYIKTRQELGQARKAISQKEEGLEDKKKQALMDLENANIDLTRLEKFLDKTKKRTEEIEQFKSGHPEAEVLIDELVAAYDAYAKIAGRLDDPEDLKRQLQGSGVLEFRILPQVTETDRKLSEGEIKNFMDRLEQYGPKKASDENYVWEKIKNPDEFKTSGTITGVFAEERYVLTSNQPDEALLHVTAGDVWRLEKARIGTDSLGGWAVNFNFNEIGANLFWKLTKNNIDRPLCILLDDEAISAPNINSAIRESGQITGQFNQLEAQDLVDKLNAGSLPARLGDEPISVNTIGPTMGRDNLRSSLIAGKYSLIVVVVFMILYYHIAGSLSALALVLNLLIVIGVMAFSRATFTMPGIAGLILTIGMAVDANVLIFERIREEQARGSSLRIAIKNGFDRAFRTIFDSNATTVLVALILWIFASEEVKGFALTLMIGLVSNLFTAVFVTRMVFDFLTSRGIIKNNLSMLHIIENPKIDWLGKRTIFWTISALLVLGSWVVFLARDETNPKYAIEFTGGTSIHVILTEKGVNEWLTDQDKQLTAEDQALVLREKIEQAVRNETDNPLLMAAGVQRIGPAEQHRFEIVTTETNRVEVTLKLDEKNKMTAVEIQDALRLAAANLGDRRMESATVQEQASAGTFLIETKQTALDKINSVLEQALPISKYNYTETKKTNRIVSDAIFSALGDKLDVLADLAPTYVAGEPITDELISQKPYLSEFTGGLYLKYNFGSDRTETLDRLQRRLTQSRFKSEFEQFGHEEAHLFAPDNNSEGPDDMLQGIELAVISKDVVYEGSRDEPWTKFEANETERFTQLLQWQTSLPQVTQIDPSVGHKSMNDTLIAIVVSMLAIIVYIWMRFGDARFGMAAVVALIHDVSITMGLVAASAWLAKTSVGNLLLISDFKIDLPMIAAFLTVIGYSLNDTIVIFDRIRENRGKLATLSSNIINSSINQTLSRTLLTGTTTLFVLVIMYIWGGAGLRGFNYVLIIGIVIGTYSSVGIAAPLLYMYGTKAGADVTDKSSNNSK